MKNSEKAITTCLLITSIPFGIFIGMLLNMPLIERKLEFKIDDIQSEYKEADYWRNKYHDKNAGYYELISYKNELEDALLWQDGVLEGCGYKGKKPYVIKAAKGIE